MKFSYALLLLLVLGSLTCFSEKEVKTLLLNKEEYKQLENNNLLITKAIENAFGKPTRQNNYKLEITQVDAWAIKVPEFQYYPSVSGDEKKEFLRSGVIASKENILIKLRVSLNKFKSVVNASIIPYLDASKAFVLNIIVIGDPRIFVSEVSTKSEFLTIIDDKGFAENAFTGFFGDNPKKINYNIAFESPNACLVKNIIAGNCVENYGGNAYDKFSEKITSAEYSSAYVLIDLHVIRQKSSLTPDIEAAIIKEADGSEHLKFYFCIPKDNIRGKNKKEISVEGKIVSESKSPVKGLVVYLRDGLNLVIATQTTDNNGLFKFEKIKEGIGYSLFIDNSCKEPSLYLMNKKNEMLGQYKKTDIGFVYKLLDADLVKLSDIEDHDPSQEFISSVKGKMLSVTDKINPIKNQVIELKNNINQVIQSQKTDNQGNFEFKHIDPKANYSIELPNYIAATKTEKVYLANAKNEFVKEFVRDKNNKFSYKLIQADMHLLRTMNDEDVEMTFTKQKTDNSKEIIINDYIYFNLNSSQLSSGSKPTLDKIAKIVSENPEYKLDIISHTDCRGENNENQKLSEKRSESVITYFTTKSIDAKRLKPIGMGESKPLNTCVDGSSCLEEEYKMNRRTEFRFYK